MAVERPMTPTRFVLHHPTLRLIAVAIALLGAYYASVYPYQSLIAVERIGMSKSAFSLLLVLASAVAVTSSVLVGILGDRFGHRRLIALGTALCGTVGVGLMLVWPGVWALILCQGVLIPVSSSLYGQLLALARLVSAGSPGQRNGVLATTRAAMSFAFLSMLIFWTFAFGAGLSVMSVYVSGGVVILALLLLIWRYWPREGQTEWEDRRSGIRLGEALAEIAKPKVALRVGLLGALASVTSLYMVLVSLVFDASATRGPADVALYVGMVAGWEVPAMLILPRFARQLSAAALMVIGAGLYACHMLAMPFLADSALIWVLPLCAGVGGAVVITLPIAYYQDLLHERPGTAAAMLAVQKLVSDALTAAIFALGIGLGGYGTVALIGVLVSLTGGIGLYFADRRGWFLPRS